MQLNHAWLHGLISYNIPFQCFSSLRTRGCLCISLVLSILHSISARLDWISGSFIHKFKTDFDTPSNAKCMYSGDTLRITSKRCKQLSHDGPIDPNSYTIIYIQLLSLFTTQIQTTVLCLTAFLACFNWESWVLIGPIGVSKSYKNTWTFPPSV